MPQKAQWREKASLDMKLFLSVDQRYDPNYLEPLKQVSFIHALETSSCAQHNLNTPIRNNI